MPNVDKTGIEFLTSGTYQRAIVNDAGRTLAAGTEYEVADVATSIAGSASKDTMYRWIRCRGWFINTASSEITGVEWALVKCQSADGLQDLNDAPTVEGLQREKRILARGMALMMGAQAREFKFEKFKVRLLLGEELRMVVRPLYGTTGGTFYTAGVIEWRQVGE